MSISHAVVYFDCQSPSPIDSLPHPVRSTLDSLLPPPPPHTNPDVPITAETTSQTSPSMAAAPQPLNIPGRWSAAIFNSARRPDVTPALIRLPTPAATSQSARTNPICQSSSPGNSRDKTASCRRRGERGAPGSIVARREAAGPQPRLSSIRLSSVHLASA